MAAVPQPRSSTPAPARSSAYRVLRRVFEQGAYADRALPAETARLDTRDRGLAMRLAYGAVQRRGTLDHLIEGLAGRPVARLDPPILAALRLGLYELLYLDGSPDYAVVADAVELAKRSVPRGHGLVNAVLRRAAREGRAGLLDPLSDDSPQTAAIRHSHPEWIARLWWETLGPDAARALMAADNEPSEVALRANTLVTDAERLQAELGVPSRRDPAIAEALVLQEPLDLRGSPAWERGAFAAQSRAAMLVAHAVGPLAGERVLDLCAAPGGKTTHLAALMRGAGELVAVEQNPSRARELRETAARLHASNVRVEVADAATFADERGFDRVLVDPPCSGLGTLQARPDLRWRVEPSSIGELAGLQTRILTAAAACVRPGGVLVYSTCTISSTENERLIADFLDSRPEFALDDLAAALPAPASSVALAYGERSTTPAAERLVLTLPHRDRTAGFFIARLRRG